MAWTKDPERVAINQHLHRMHEGYAASGDTLSRLVAHDVIHSEGEAGGWAGKPLHRHNPETGALEFKEEEE